MHNKLLKLLPFRNLCTLRSQIKVCIVGAGPAGFYAAMHITKNISNAKIDIIEKLPVPFGLIRYGVAPDHPEVKNVINQFTKVAQLPNVNFYGNISLGSDISLKELRKHYDAVLLTYGAEEDKFLGIENENANNIVAARRFVGWYNGLPQDKDLKVNLSGTTAAVLGQGNVALDVARILLTPIDELRKTDITEHALNALSESKIKELYLIGRRGPLNVAFTIKELREQIKLKNCSTIWKKEDFAAAVEAVPNLERPRKRLTELMLKSLNEMKESSQYSKQFRPLFYRSPNRFLVNNNNDLVGIELTCNKIIGDKLDEQRCVPTDIKETLECHLAFRSIGYKSKKIENDLICDPGTGVIINEQGRIVDNCDENLGKLYVAGWLGTGPVGVILHTMGHAFHVAKVMCEDLKSEPIVQHAGFEEIRKVLDSKNVQIVNWNGWEKIDKYEVEEGKKVGKPREKVCSIRKMLDIAL